MYMYIFVCECVYFSVCPFNIVNIYNNIYNYIYLILIISYIVNIYNNIYNNLYFIEYIYLFCSLVSFSFKCWLSPI